LKNATISATPAARAAGADFLRPLVRVASLCIFDLGGHGVVFRRTRASSGLVLAQLLPASVGIVSDLLLEAAEECVNLALGYLVDVLGDATLGQLRVHGRGVLRRRRRRPQPARLAVRTREVVELRLETTADGGVPDGEQIGADGGDV
jgi:hypothetical protein